MESLIIENEYGTTLSSESIKVFAESIGIGNLSEESAEDLAQDVTCKLKLIIQDAIKYMRHEKRKLLTTQDIHYSMIAKNVEPIYGFFANNTSAFRFTSGGGKELYFPEEKEIDLSNIEELVNNLPVPKVPLKTKLHHHWLCINGVQTAAPENSCAYVTEKTDNQNMKKESPKPDHVKNKKKSCSKESCKLKNIETVQVKQLADHYLSSEQQLYYKEIVEACIRSDESRRLQAFNSLSTDPSILEMTAPLITFIEEGVQINIQQKNLAILIYLMRMVKALLENQNLDLQKYLHILIPTIISCVVSKQLCMRPDADNHWALRDFAARLVAQICKIYNNPINNIYNRIVAIYCQVFSKNYQSLDKNNQTCLTSLYGGIQGLYELGSDCVKLILIPKIKFISEVIGFIIEGSNYLNLDKNNAGHIKTLIIKAVAPVLKSIRPSPDFIEEYKEEYGYIGSALCTAVTKARSPTQTLISTVKSLPVSNNKGPFITKSVESSIQKNCQVTSIHQSQVKKVQLVVRLSPTTGQKSVISLSQPNIKMEPT